ncbi:hypothetical protein L596_018996 [Steinernema carpocapsae]|uniref:Uncharacterized protein n=1 Tax=Steinernema carpocapsae TaxID=34508 RepID=A0A4U5N6U7_STECR|nr:hypothetical protein L596_018996 [Steinernema carpocapsae]
MFGSTYPTWRFIGFRKSDMELVTTSSCHLCPKSTPALSKSASCDFFFVSRRLETFVSAFVSLLILKLSLSMKFTSWKGSPWVFQLSINPLLLASSDCHLSPLTTPIGNPCFAACRSFLKRVL